VTKGEDELIPTRASLLSRLKDVDDHASWKVFFDTYWKLIYKAAIKAGLSDAEAQDAVQETVLAVLKSMPEFKYRSTNSSFKSWLLKLTSWRVSDQFRKRRQGHPAMERVEPYGKSGEVDSGELLSEAEKIPDPAGCALEAIWDEEWEKNLMDAALDRVKRAVDPKQYQIFDLYVEKGWPAGKVASTLKINMGRVYLAKYRIGSMLKQEIDRLRTKPID
jgi:RNA polymerase sigma-70 factor (ECF subfamily)